MKRYRVWTLALVAAVGLAACSGGDDSTGPSGDELSAPEAEALAAVIASEALGLGLEQFSGSGGLAPSGSAASEPQDISIDEFTIEGPCELGGTVTLTMSWSGTADYEVGNIDLSWNVTQVHDSCVLQEDQYEFTLTGDPDISMTWDMQVTENESFDISGGYGGAVQWSLSDGRSGRCTVDVSFSATGNWATGSGTTTVNGHVCGVSVDQQTTV